MTSVTCDFCGLPVTPAAAHTLRFSLDAPKGSFPYYEDDREYEDRDLCPACFEHLHSRLSKESPHV